MPRGASSRFWRRRDSSRSSGTRGTERREDPGPLRARHRLAAVAASGELCDLVAAEPAEPLDQSRQVEPREAGLDHESSRVAGVPRPVQEDDRAAQRVAEDDRPRDADRVAEGAHVVGARLEAPPRGVAPVGAAVPAQIEVDDLRVVGEPGEGGLEVRVVVGSGPPVNQHHGRPLPHRDAVRYERRTLDVEPQTDSVDLYPHCTPSLSLPRRRTVLSGDARRPILCRDLRHGRRRRPGC